MEVYVLIIRPMPFTTMTGGTLKMNCIYVHTPLAPTNI